MVFIFWLCKENCLTVSINLANIYILILFNFTISENIGIDILLKFVIITSMAIRLPAVLFGFFIFVLYFQGKCNFIHSMNIVVSLTVQR